MKFLHFLTDLVVKVKHSVVLQTVVSLLEVSDTTVIRVVRFVQATDRQTDRQTEINSFRYSNNFHTHNPSSISLSFRCDKQPFGTQNFYIFCNMLRVYKSQLLEIFFFCRQHFLCISLKQTIFSRLFYILLYLFLPFLLWTQKFLVSALFPAFIKFSLFMRRGTGKKLHRSLSREQRYVAVYCSWEQQRCWFVFFPMLRAIVVATYQ